MYSLTSSNFSQHLLPWKNIAQKLQCAKIDGGQMPQNIISLQANFIETSLRRRFFLRSGRMFSDHSFRGCFVGNKAVGRISKRRQKENKARQIFPKKNIFYLLISTRTYFACFVFAYDSNRCQKFYRLALISAFKTSTECIFYLH